MKSAIRAALIGASIYTIAVSWLLWTAFFGKAPNDAGIVLFFTAWPTSFLVKFFDYGAVYGWVAAVLHQSVNDRLAMCTDACIAWLFGCIQYGIVGIAVRDIAKSIRA